MSATVAAALKKIAVSLLTNPKVLKTIGGIVLGIIIIIVMPIVAVVSIFNGDINIDTDRLQQMVVQNLSAEEQAKLQFVEDTMYYAIEDKMIAAGFEGKVKEAQVLYVLYLSEYAGDASFVSKLVGCFAADQTDEQLISAVNAAFGTNLDADDFSALMVNINHKIVEVARSQIGNVGGEPYWSWYGFESRVEWCACFVSWCYGQSGRTEPRFAGCQSQGVPWFQSHGQWGARGYENIAPGDAIFFDWDLDGSADHVGIVVGTDGSRVYTVEGNSGDACKIKSYRCV